MNQTLKTIILIVATVSLTACELRKGWNNPFDYDCPKEIFTPTNITAIQEGEAILLSWEQPDLLISGFIIERKIDNRAWDFIYQPNDLDFYPPMDYENTSANHTNIYSKGKTFYSWIDEKFEGGHTYHYRITAFAEYHASNCAETEVTLVPEQAFTDSRDGSVYRWVKIGDQTWMAENLRYLPSVSPATEGSETEPYYYVYGYPGTSVESAKKILGCVVDGVTYNWQAAKTACPQGWHLPTCDEWQTLAEYISNDNGGYEFFLEWKYGGRWENVGKHLKALWGWEWKLDLELASNDYGFSATEGGIRSPDGNFWSGCDFWSATKQDSGDGNERAYYWSLYPNDITFNYRPNSLDTGMSVRCIKD